MSDITGYINFTADSTDIDTIHSALKDCLDFYGNEGGALDSTNVDIMFDEIGQGVFQADFYTDYDKADWDGNGAYDIEERENYQAMLYGFINGINSYGKATFMNIVRNNGMDAVDGPEKTFYRLNNEDKTEILESEAVIIFSEPVAISKSNIA